MMKNPAIFIFVLGMLAILPEPGFTNGFLNDGYGARALAQANAFIARALDPSRRL